MVVAVMAAEAWQGGQSTGGRGNHRGRQGTGKRKGPQAGAGTGTGQLHQQCSTTRQRHDTALHVWRQARPLRQPL